MKLPDVIDLEVQLALDAGQDEAELRERDRALYLQLAPAPSRVDALLVAWLGALRERSGGPHVGERVASAQRILAYVLALTGAASGWGVAEVLLHFEQGGAPVNVGNYLLVMVFGQLALLLLLGLGLLLRGVWPELPVLGDLARLLRFLAARLQRLWVHSHARVGARFEAEQAAFHRVRTRLGLYRDIERYLLLSHTQLFAFAFNLGALASCLRLILLSDLAFAWSTSLATLSASDVHRLCALLAWPFAWLLPDALPTPWLIEHTQYFRLEGRFAGASAGSRGDAALVGEWWRFLVACTVSYGLLPRLFSYGLFAAKFRRAERDVPLDTPLVLRTLARLTTPALSTRARELVAQAPEPARASQPPVDSAGGPTALLLYRDIPTEVALLSRAVAQRFGVEVTSVDRAGGQDARGDAALCARLGQSGAGVTVVAEAWEAPDKSLRHLLSALRSALGPRRLLRVALIGEASDHCFTAPAAQDVRVFADRLTLLEDPYLSVESLPGSTRPQAADVGGHP